MKPEDIKIDDWSRIFAGPVPAEFYIELVIRGFLFLALLLFSLRLIGKRMTAHLSQLELVALVSLASAIGVPMLAPDRGILPPFIIAAIVVGVTRLITKLSFKSKKFEDFSQGAVDTIIEDGVLKYKTMERARISPERLFAQLRNEGIRHTGEVKRVYLEPNGAFTIIRNEQASQGLMVIPDWDKTFVKSKLANTATILCKYCGTKRSHEVVDNKCPQCGNHQWVEAVKSRT